MDVEVQEAEVRENSNNNQKIITVPADSNIEAGDHVKILGMGSQWHKIPGYFKMHSMISGAMKLLIKSDNELDSINYNDADESIELVRKAGELCGEAMDELDNQFTIYPTQEEQKLIEDA